MGKEKDTRRITDEHDLIEDRKMVLMKKIKKVESVIAELPEEWIDVVEDHLDYIICKCTGEIE